MELMGGGDQAAEFSKKQHEEYKDIITRIKQEVKSQEFKNEDGDPMAQF